MQTAKPAIIDMQSSYSNTSKSMNLVKLCLLTIYGLLCHMCNASWGSWRGSIEVHNA